MPDFQTPFTTGQGVQTPFNQGPTAMPQGNAPIVPQMPAPAQAVPPPTPSIPLDVVVTHDYATGKSADEIVASLMGTKTAGAQVREALNKGTDAKEIVAQWGGKPLQAFKETDPTERVKAQSFLTNLVQGAGEGVKDVGLSLGQIAAQLPSGVAAGEGGGDMGNQSALPQQLMDVQKAREADPHYQALMNTAGGKTGDIATKAVPYIAAGSLAPEGLLPGILAQTAAGAAGGALTPTTKDGDRLKNVATDAAIGGATQGVLGGAPVVAKKVLGAVTNSAKDTGLAQEMAAQGLSPTIGTTSPMAKALANKVADAKNAINEAGKKDVLQAALKHVGVDGTDLSSETLNTAERNIWRPANQVVQSVHVPPTPELTQSLTQIAQQYGHDALPTFANGKVNGVITDVLAKAESGQLTGPRLLDYLRDTKDLAFNADNAADRNAFKAISSTLSDTLSAASPDGGAALAQANKLHPKLLVLRDVASRAKDELPTIGQWATSNSKYADKNAVGPLSDLIATAKKAYTEPAGSSGRWASLISGAIQHGPAAAAGIHGLLTGGIEEGITHGLAGGLAEKALAKGIAKLVNKPVGTGVKQVNVQQNPKMQALSKALGNVGRGGLNATIVNGANQN